MLPSLIPALVVSARPRGSYSDGLEFLLCPSFPSNSVSCGQEKGCFSPPSPPGPPPPPEPPAPPGRPPPSPSPSPPPNPYPIAPPSPCPSPPLPLLPPSPPPRPSPPVPWRVAHGCLSTYQMCNDPQCCASERDACFTRIGRGFKLCRPLDSDGGCRDSLAWECPRATSDDDDGGGGGGGSSDVPAKSLGASFTSTVDAFHLAADSQEAALPSSGEQGSRNPIVLVLGATASVVLVLLLAVTASRRGGTRGRPRRAKHARIDAVPPARHDDDEGDDGDDEILGDDYESAAPGHPSATAGPAVPLTNDGHIHGHKGMPPMAAGPELAEDALMNRVHALLRDADSHADSVCDRVSISQPHTPH